MYGRPMSETTVDLQSSSNQLQTLSNAEQAEHTGLRRMPDVRIDVETAPRIFNRQNQTGILAPKRNSRSAFAGMF